MHAAADEENVRRVFVALSKGIEITAIPVGNLLVEDCAYGRSVGCLPGRKRLGGSDEDEAKRDGLQYFVHKPGSCEIATGWR